jgi:hypothetical protein
VLFWRRGGHGLGGVEGSRHKGVHDVVFYADRLVGRGAEKDSGSPGVCIGRGVRYIGFSARRMHVRTDVEVRYDTLS